MTFPIAFKALTAAYFLGVIIVLVHEGSAR